VQLGTLADNASEFVTIQQFQAGARDPAFGALQ
jgi:hypothetical protein